MADESTGLGKLITADKGRDAVHVAIAPITADEKLYPGQWCSVSGDRARFAADGKGTGIVDPFLTAAVQPGQRFWLWMAPGSIKSLRHEWTHPALDLTATAVAHAFVENLGKQMGMTFEGVMDAARRFQESDHELVEWRFKGMSMPEDFWDHYEVLTGTKVTNRETFFHCGGCS